MPTRNDLLTLSRADLYELVWSKPMSELAKDFGLSDVALAKRCRKLGVPVPGRGYWARVAAGQTPHRPKLSKRVETHEDERALTFDVPQEKPPPTPAAGEPTDVANLRQTLQTIQVTANVDLRSASPPVKRTAVHLKRPWRGEIQWSRGERKGPTIALDVDEGTADRALLVADRLISAAASVGWAFNAPSDEDDALVRRYPHLNRSPQFGHVDVQGEALGIRIRERQRRIEHVLTESEKARKRKGHSIYPPRWDYIPSGELHLTVARPEDRYVLRTWKDSKRRPLQEQINTMLLGLLEEALRIKADREKRRLAEIERRREEEIRWRQSQRRAANAKLIHELEAQAGAWLRARFLRSYLRALRRALGTQRLQAKRGDETVDFLDWADYYVDQLDPLGPAPHDEDLKADRSSYHSRIETRVTETLYRLLGHGWEEAFKIGETDSDSEE